MVVQINTDVKHAHKQELLASQRAAPVKPQVPEGGALVSFKLTHSLNLLWDIITIADTCQEITTEDDSRAAARRATAATTCQPQHCICG